MTPWQLAGTTEHSQQRALFAWASCAALYGIGPAGIAEVYDAKLRPAFLKFYGGQGKVLVPEPILSRLFAIHNQGHGDAVRGGRAKAEGVKAGVPDLMLPVPNGAYAGLFIELKRPKTAGVAKGSASGAQNDWIEFLRKQGYHVVVAFGWEEAKDAILAYLGYRA